MGETFGADPFEQATSNKSSVSEKDEGTNRESNLESIDEGNEQEEEEINFDQMLGDVAQDEVEMEEDRDDDDGISEDDF